MNPLAATPTLAGGVALLPALSAMILGDVREDSPALRYALGQAFAATLPQSALLIGLPESEAQVLWNAMLAAFGPPEFGKLGDPAATRLVQTFWNTIPPRSQRRLQELLAKAPTDFATALDRARQSGRRVALFVSGDIGYVLRVVAAELELPQALLAVDRMNELVEGIADRRGPRATRGERGVRRRPLSRDARRRPAWHTLERQVQDFMKHARVLVGFAFVAASAIAAACVLADPPPIDPLPNELRPIILHDSVAPSALLYITAPPTNVPLTFTVPVLASATRASRNRVRRSRSHFHRDARKARQRHR